MRTFARLAVLASLLAPLALADEVARVGEKAPDFTLTDLDGKEHSLGKYVADGKIVVLEWTNPDCPFVVKHHRRHKTMAETSAKFAEQGVVWIAINSGKPGKQGTGVERNRRAVEEYGIAYPVCLDETSEVGRRYGAQVTPHMFVIDKEGILRYAGAIDNDRGMRPGDVNHVAKALEAILAGREVETKETRPYG